MRIRQAEPADAPAMSRILEEIAARQGSSRPTDAGHVLRRYVEHPDRLSCALALDQTGAALGFQSLKRAAPGNIYELPEGWGVIGTHVSPRAARMGVGARLFDVSLAAARTAGLRQVEARIGRDNAPALAFYAALGFETYALTETADRKALILSAS